MTVVTDVMPKVAASALSVEDVSHAYGSRVALNIATADVSFTSL